MNEMTMRVAMLAAALMLLPGVARTESPVLDDACQKNFPASEAAARCRAAGAAVEAKLAADDVKGAMDLLIQIDDSIHLFKSPPRTCWGSLGGGSCTLDEWKALKYREVYSNDAALQPPWADWGPLLQSVGARRRAVVAASYERARAALASGVLEQAIEEKAAGDLLGGSDLDLERLVRETWFEEQARDVAAREPDFIEGKTRWYKTGVFEPRTRPIGNGCKLKFGDDVETMNPNSSTVTCTRFESRPLSAEVLDGVREAIKANAKVPPTSQKTTGSIWRAALARSALPSACPNGMAFVVEPDTRSIDSIDRCLKRMDRTIASVGFDEVWERCASLSRPSVKSGCTASLPQHEFCPTGRFGEEGVCVVSECLSGTASLRESSEGVFEGPCRRPSECCFRCPVGKLDLVQTAANMGWKWNQIRKERRRVTELLCRVDPDPPAAKKPAKK